LGNAATVLPLPMAQRELPSGGIISCALIDPLVKKERKLSGHLPQYKHRGDGLVESLCSLEKEIL